MSINHNKFNLQVGERAILDKEFRNSSEITIISFSPKKLFVRVKSDNGNEWETMTNRLTPKDNGQK